MPVLSRRSPDCRRLGQSVVLHFPERRWTVTHLSGYAGPIMNVLRQAGIFALSMLLQFEGPSASSGLALLTNSTWTDKSPHASQLIQVNGIRLHYLDWGGHGGDAPVFSGSREQRSHFRWHCATVYKPLPCAGDDAQRVWTI